MEANLVSNEGGPVTGGSCLAKYVKKVGARAELLETTEEKTVPGPVLSCFALPQGCTQLPL